VLRHNGAKKKQAGCARQTHTQGERDRLPKRPMIEDDFYSLSESVKIPFGWEAPEGIRLHTRSFVNI